VLKKSSSSLNKSLNGVAVRGARLTDTAAASRSGDHVA